MLRVFFVWLAIAVLSSASLAIAADEGPTTEDIKLVQELLSRLGFDPGPQDGICGDKTISAVRAFHAANNLPLQPGHIEPQAATVAENLMTAMRDSIMRPQTPPSNTYRKALAGDAESAYDVGATYFHGERVVPDNMLAYLWWTVSELNGNLIAPVYKEKLIENRLVTSEQAAFATVLAKQIVWPMSKKALMDKPILGNSPASQSASTAIR